MADDPLYPMEWIRKNLALAMDDVLLSKQQHESLMMPGDSAYGIWMTTEKQPVPWGFFGRISSKMDYRVKDDIKRHVQNLREDVEALPESQEREMARVKLVEFEMWIDKIKL